MEHFSKGYSFRRYWSNRLRGNIVFPTGHLGRFLVLPGEKEEKATQSVEIFRQVIFHKPAVEEEQAVLFHVKFHLKGMSPWLNKLFSKFPISFFAGLPGFCAKYWCYSKSTGDFHGFYKWRTKAHAEAYSQSYAMRFMTRRSVPGSVDFEILPFSNNPYEAYPDQMD